MPNLTQAELSEFGRNLDALRMRHMVEAGQRGGLRVEAFVPATGIGKFDAVYSPQSHRFEVTIKARFDFVGVGPDPTQSEEAWTAIEQQKFISDTQREVAEWSEKYTLACAKPGWEKFYADVHVRMEVVPAGQEYYIVRARKIKNYKSSGGIDHGSVPHICMVNNWANEKDTAKSAASLFNFKEGLYRGKLRDSVPDKSGDFIEFSANSSTLSTADQLRLNQFANFINSNRPPELKGIKVYAVGITGKNDSVLKRGLSKGRTAAVVAAINARVLGGDFAEAASADEAWAKEGLKLIKTRPRNPALGNGGVLLIVRTPAGVARELPLNYVVMRHEAGHMIGLPDEYNGVRSTDTQSKMQLDAVVPSTYVASTLQTDGDHARLQRMQDGMVRNLKTANIPAPLFMGMTGRGDGEEARLHSGKQDAWEKGESAAATKFGRGTDELKKWRLRNPQPVAPTAITTISTSIMHSGEEMLPAHYITFWSALSKMTDGYIDPDQWKIVPTGKGQSTLRYYA